MVEHNQNRIVVDDTRERAQLERTQQSIEEQRKAILKQKYIQKQMKKYKLFRFSNWLLWITLVALVIGGIFAYNKFLYLGSDYWGKEGGYSRLENRGSLNSDALKKVNQTYESKDGKSAHFEQHGPSVDLLVHVPAGMGQQEAQRFTEEVIDECLKELGDSKSSDAPYGKTFMNYDLNILVTQKDMNKPDDATLNQLGSLDGPEKKVTYPFFGTIHKGVMTWTNNIG